MNEYRYLYCLRIEHDYYKDKACRAIDVRVSPPGKELMRRRGWLFRQTAVNEWTIVCNEASAGIAPDDVLVFDLYLADPAFTLFTEWPAFEPQQLYSLRLPAEAPEQAITLFQKFDKRSIGSGFCKAELHFTTAMPDPDRLAFRARKQHWEYLFVSRDRDFQDGSNLVLKEAKGQLTFEKFEPTHLLGHKAWRTVSVQPVAACERYDYNLSLLEKMPGNARSHLVRMKSVPHPIIGNHLGTPVEMLRHICYI